MTLDNAGCHADEGELTSDEMRTLFLPKNFPSLIQPMDQGV